MIVRCAEGGSFAWEPPETAEVRMVYATLADAARIDVGVSKGGAPGELWVMLRAGSAGDGDRIVRLQGDAAKAVYHKFGEALALLALANPSGTIQSQVGANQGMVTLDLWEIMKPERCVGISLYPTRAREMARLLDEAADYADHSQARLRLVKADAGQERDDMKLTPDAPTKLPLTLPAGTLVGHRVHAVAVTELRLGINEKGERIYVGQVRWPDGALSNPDARWLPRTIPMFERATEEKT